METDGLVKQFRQLQDRLNDKVGVLRNNQKAIYKATLMVNVISEDLVKMTQTSNLQIASTQSKNLMREAETLEIDTAKTK